MLGKNRPVFLDAAALRRGAGRRTMHVDATCTFVATRDLLINRTAVLAGQIIDKTLVGSDRRLRQMYEARAITLAPTQPQQAEQRGSPRNRSVDASRKKTAKKHTARKPLKRTKQLA